MRNRIERLRLWLAVSAALLLAVLLGFIATARYLKRHALARLGSHLGIDIRSETNGFTYSQSLQGRTIYTIHAAKEIEHSNGVIGLHDVSMIIFGRTGDRADMVYGNEFEYDKNAGEVRAIGLVHIDVGGAGSATPGTAAAKLLAQGHDDPNQAPKVLHATTSGLVYLDKLGIAATKEPIEFVTGQLTGHAVGADYNTDTGTLLLHSAVNIAGTANKQPISITAVTAQIDNRGQRAVLAHAHYVSTDESMDANQVILHSRPDSSLEGIEADGSVHVQQRGAQLNAAHADLALTPKNKVQNSVFSGGVQYTRDEPMRQARGEARQVVVTFDPAGAPLHAVFNGSVHMIERSRSTEEAKQPWAVRDLTADHVDTMLSPTKPGRSELRDAQAKGNARLTMVDNGVAGKSRGRGTTELAGDSLSAHLLPAALPNQSSRLDSLIAQGNTSVRQLDADGLEQTSTGDTLNARFRSYAAGTGNKPGLSAGAEELASAVQIGHVHMIRKAPHN
jgi:lipopolysaccharide export system protein LptA